MQIKLLWDFEISTSLSQNGQGKTKKRQKHTKKNKQPPPTNDAEGMQEKGSAPSLLVGFHTGTYRN